MGLTFPVDSASLKFGIWARLLRHPVHLTKRNSSPFAPGAGFRILGSFGFFLLRLRKAPVNLRAWVVSLEVETSLGLPSFVNLLLALGPGVTRRWLFAEAVVVGGRLGWAITLPTLPACSRHGGFGGYYLCSEPQPQPPPKGTPSVCWAWIERPLIEKGKATVVTGQVSAGPEAETIGSHPMASSRGKDTGAGSGIVGGAAGVSGSIPTARKGRSRGRSRGRSVRSKSRYPQGREASKDKAGNGHTNAAGTADQNRKKELPKSWANVARQQEGHKRLLPRDYNPPLDFLTRCPSMRDMSSVPILASEPAHTMQQGMEPFPRLDAQTAASRSFSLVSRILMHFLIRL
ncbi:hypothetical protein NL676_034825 [Syzygium grande]|nr:hypothetical protein NL676_034825 [Syzygium grande]